MATNVTGKGSPRPVKRVLEERDISDGRTEEEKIRDQMEKEEKEKLEEIKKMNEWRQQQKDKEKEAAPSSIINEEKLNQARMRAKIDESDSSLMSDAKPSAQKEKGPEESYSSDAFEDVSMSGSGSKKLDLWSGNKNKGVKPEDSVVSSNSNLTSSQLKSVERSGKSQKSSQGISDSSDRYDADEFDSLSKSKDAIGQMMKKAEQKTGAFSVNVSKSKPVSMASQKAAPQPVQILSTVTQYKNKENKQTMTDFKVKYDYMSAKDGEPQSMKEWSLQKELDDAHLLIQELKAKQAEDKEDYRALELKLKQKEGDYSAARREALGAQETSNRMKEKIETLQHNNNLYKVETERLIKEIDMADAKTREKESDLMLAQAEYDRKLKAVEERILYSRGKQEDRKVLDLKHDHAIALEEQRRANDEKAEEISYLNEKVLKLQEENKNLILKKDTKAEQRELEQKVAHLTAQLEQVENQTKYKTPEFSTATAKKDLSPLE